MKKQALTTQKVVTYTLDDVERAIKNMRSQPKAIVIHCGTNDIKNNVPTKNIVENYSRIVHLAKEKFEETEIIISSIAPRDGSEFEQRQVNFINAAVHMELAGEATIVCNREITGRGLKKKDGIHLTDIGTSHLARNIKEGIQMALQV